MTFTGANNAFCELQITKCPVYLDLVDQWSMPQLQADSQDFIYQKDGAPSHFQHDVHEVHDANLHVAGVDVLLKMTFVFFRGLQDHLT